MLNENGETENDQLERLRDERCFPIVRALVKEFPEGLVVDPEDQKKLQLQSLSLMLAADLNVAQEVSYVSQLTLGVLSGLNAAIQTAGLENDEVKYEFLAGDVLKILADHIDTMKLDAGPEESIKEFAKIQEKLIALFKENELSLMEAKYIIQKILESFTTLNNAVSSSIENSTKRMEEKILGIESMGDLTLQKLNDVLVKPQ